ncbi:MAG: GNAT family N-acetyltransferase [Planctomycetota bacterium]
MTRIRAATAADIDAIAAFQARMALTTEGRRLDPGPLRRGVAAVLGDPDRGRYLVVEDEAGAAVASLLLTREWSDWRDGWFWWIQSVWIEEAWRGRGLYRALHDEVRRQARQQGDVVGLRLYVERDNRHARAVYDRVGMSESVYLLYEEVLPPPLPDGDRGA